MRVLLIEDDVPFARGVELMLKHGGHVLHRTESGEEGVLWATSGDYDVIILDLHLPDISGYEVALRLRRRRVRTPILVLTGYYDLDSKVESFGVGADDFLTKPFEKRELLARLEALCRRGRGHASSVVEVGRLTVNLSRRTAEGEKGPIGLTKKEYQVLELLCLRRGTIVPREGFLDHLYGGVDEPEAKIIDVYVCKLRKKLSQGCGGGRYIENVWGRGYVLRDPDPTEEEAA